MLAYRNAIVRLLLLAHDEHVRDLAKLRLANLALDRLAALVELGARADRDQLPPHARAVIVEAVGHRKHDRLHRREPQRQLARMVLDEDADEALEGAEQRAVDHRRAVPGLL